MSHLLGCAARVDVLHPAASQAVYSWHPDTADLTLTLPVAPSAVLLRLAHAAPDTP
ncbi:hypothetical protein OHT68_04000 [Streptomyces canus]|uniref:hypothetical protein n=1 Tax=Streptomyces canus TaxID=58343 RepID=UPI002E2E39ED|nr:hypothetical protein [Streptomyces canus]